MAWAQTVLALRAMDRSGAEAKGPVDTGYVAYLIFFLMGAGTLLPWNIFINAAPYFKVRFAGTHFSDNFESFFGIGFNITNVLGLWLLTKHQHRVPPRMRAAPTRAAQTPASFPRILLHII